MKLLSRLIAFLLPLAASAGEFKVGAAQVDITPANGTPMAGYYKFRAVDGVLDPIYAKAIVVEQDGARAVFVVLDLAGTTRPLVAAARKLITEQCRLPGDRVMISATHTLQRRKFSEAEIAKAKDIADRMFTENLGTVPMAEAVCILETIAKQDVPLEAELQVVAFSDDLAIVSLPGEIFVELGLTIKAASPFKHTFIAELANGSIGYVPNRDAYPQGNYEVVSARGEAGTGEKLVETALGLLKELARR